MSKFAVKPSAPSPVRALFAALRPRAVRTYREFAEQEIILPNGPRAGLHFDCDFMPWTAKVFAEFDHDRYRRRIGSGPVQAGKTLIFFVVPAMYHLFEIGENVIIGVPKMDLAQGIYEERLLPAIQRSRYRDLLPTKGSGSRGGKFVTIRFRNGAVLRFMGAGGGDEQRSSHTARVIILTEIDKMDQAGRASREADPVTQIEARSNAYGARAVIYAECTMSVETGRVHREVVQFGTDTRVAIPCQHCGEFVVPERDHFVGWQGAVDIIAAREAAAYACPSCGSAWTESDRLESLKRPVLVSKGQTVDASGSVSGPPPKTNTFGFSWNAMHSSLTTMADIAETEWRADQSENPEDMKSVMQFTWAQPYQADVLDLSGVSIDAILAKIGPTPRGVCPAGTARLTVAIDLGLHLCWWSAWAWRENAAGTCIDYGALRVPQERKTDPVAILARLREFRDNVLEFGWTLDGKPKTHDVCLVDSGWDVGQEVSYAFVLESGQPRYLASKGLGTDRREGSWREPKPAKGRTLGNQWYGSPQPSGIRLINMHSDYWKAQLHQRFTLPNDAPGVLALYSADRRDHLDFAKQLVAEKQVQEFRPGIGTVTYFNRLSKVNHYLDTAYMNAVAAEMLGIRPLQPTAAPAPRRRPPPARTSGASSIRTSYH